MGLRIYNTLTGQKEEFKALNPPEVKMYVCGPTVYDEPHIGHLRSAYVFEIIRRWLKTSGYKVTFVRNVTDVDDKIIDKARFEKGADLKTSSAAVAERYEELYEADLKRMGISKPDVMPKATGHIPQMQALISRLIEKDFAYAAAGSSDVYFDVKKFPGYGKLSKQNTEEMFEQVRVERADGKRNPLDFALWKSAKPDEPAWPFPGHGQGRPGWHIECSAMSMNYLGETFDIHGGGLDLKFPHHENEIAQSEAATGKPFAHYWIHHGLLTVNSQKMSKSLKNFIRLADVNTHYGMAALKTFFLGAQYSSSLDYSDSAMAEAKSQYERFLNFFREAKKLPGDASHDWSSFDERFREAMDDDFNTPKAFSVMHELVDAARKVKTGGAYQAAIKLLNSWGSSLGGLFDNAERLLYVRDKAQESYMEEKLKARKAAKEQKNFEAADAIRKEILAKGFEIRDLPDGTTEWWVKK